MQFRCPLCGSALTKAHYHKVIKAQAQKEKSQVGELAKLKKQVETAKSVASSAKRKNKELLQKSKRDIGAARKDATLAERRKRAIRDKRLIARIKKLEEENKMLQKHTSPQQIGLADESVLVGKLKKEFPDDRIVHAGKGGDVLHFVLFKGDDAGCIVYECKRTDRISSDHVTQTILAKKTRQANYGILVTTGSRKGFSGLDQESGIFIVAQAGVITLARICRDSLVSMARQRLDAAAKARAAKRLMDYITSPVFRTPLEDAIAQALRAQNNLHKEIRQHLGDWKERSEVYQTLHYDVSHIQKNMELVLEDRKPLPLEKIKTAPLPIPASPKAPAQLVYRKHL